MKRMLINATQQEELRVALVDGQELYDLDIETLHSGRKKSNIYKGKITRIEPSLEAVFVDYGAERNGFLPFKEIGKEYLLGSTSQSEKAGIKDMLQVGQEVLIQIEKEERGNKGAALTTYISLAGRFMVLMPNNPKAGGVSRRIQGDERKELRETIDLLDVPSDMGMIVRTAGVGRNQEEMQWDLDFLLQVWDAINSAYQKAPDRSLIYQESNIIVRALRDYLRPDIGEILIDNEAVFKQATDFMRLVMPSSVNKLKIYKDTTPLFTRYQIEGQIETAYQRSVKLPSGGELVIDYTEAMVSIDINSSRSTKGVDIEETAHQTNLEAADEIARQLRLRDIGGLIVIDFIDMSVTKHRKSIEQRLHDATVIDRARIQIARISRFGLLEMSRQRLRPSIDEASHQVCPRCKGQGSIRGIQSQALSILRLIEEDAMKEKTYRITAELPVSIATYLLNEKRAVIKAMEKRNSIEVIIIPNPKLLTPDYYIDRLREDEVSEEIGKMPSYRLPTHRETKEENAQSAQKPQVTEKPLVSNIVPSNPVPKQESKKGLSAIFSRVVALFKEEKSASAKAVEVEGKESESSKPQQNKSRNRNDRNNRDQNTDSRHTQKQHQRNKSNEGQEEKTARKNDKNADKAPQRKNENRQQNNDKKNSAQSAKKSQNVDKKISNDTSLKNSHENVDKKDKAQPAKKSQSVDKKALSDVNPTVESLLNPVEVINGHEVAKGRPRDVHAVRGAGKANADAAVNDAQVDTIVNETRAPAKKKETSAKEVDAKVEAKAKIGDVALPESAGSDQPGLVSFLEEPAEVAPKAKATKTKKVAKVAKDAPEQETDSAKKTEKEDISVDTTKKSETKVEEVVVEKPKRGRKKKVVKNANTAELTALGQSLWYDNIDRKMLNDGSLGKLVAESSIRGITSNPAIFQKAFANGSSYDEALSAWMASNDGDARDAFFALAIEDIQNACDQMKSIYDASNGTDGMVSLEVSPTLAHDAQGTIKEALALAKKVDRKNLMIKVPGTAAGQEALVELTAQGLNINVTLLFSTVQYQKVVEAYIEGLKQRLAKGLSIEDIRSVASFFVSRVDTAIDSSLSDEYATLKGRAGIANAQLAYAYYLERIAQDDWQALAKSGAAVQRLLWASTGVKNPAYRDTRYVDLLIGNNTVNTVPPKTLEAFKDHGKAEATLLQNIEKAPETIRAIEEAGVSLEAVTADLEKQGIAQFEEAFSQLLSTLEAKMTSLKEAKND